MLWPRIKGRQNPINLLTSYLAKNEVCEAEVVDSEWYNCIPFGEQQDDKTCGQILAELKRERKNK